MRVTVTVALMLAVYAIVNGNQNGWTSGQTLGLLGGAVVLLAHLPRDRVARRAPLMPLAIFRHRNVAVANVVGVLWAAAMFAWFFLSALYLQLVLGYSPLKVGPGVPAREPDHGRVLARALGEARHALRVPQAARVGLLLAALRSRAVRARAGRRQLRASTCCRR